MYVTCWFSAAESRLRKPRGQVSKVIELYLNHHLDIKLSSHTNLEISTSPDLQQTTLFNEETSRTLITKGTTHAEFDDQLSSEALVSNKFPRGTAQLFEPSSTPWTTSRIEWHKVNLSIHSLKIPANTPPEAAKLTPSPEV
jgi:hypothetical protein